MDFNIRVQINGREHRDSVEPRLLLVHYLREVLGLTGTHVGCDTSNCGACTIRIDGQQACACLVPVAQAAGTDIRTVEGLAGGNGPREFGDLAALQQEREGAVGAIRVELPTILHRHGHRHHGRGVPKGHQRAGGGGPFLLVNLLYGGHCRLPNQLLLVLRQGRQKWQRFLSVRPNAS